MSVIHVKSLKKHFKVHDKEPGFKGSIQSLFHKQYRIVKAVDKVSFDIQAGELVGFIGPNGAGKTTTLKSLSGLLYPDGGDIRVLGFTPFDRKHEFLKKIALVMGQKNQLWWDLPPIESFILNREIYEIPHNQYQNTLDKLVEMLEVQDMLKVQVRKLSLGQRMKCELIAALLHSPQVLFLDEPTIGLDVVMQKKMRDFIKDYNKEFNSTIILTSHYMDDVKELCQRVIIIDKGMILFDGKLADIIHKYADHKILQLTFSKPVTKTSLEKWATVKSFDFPQATLMVDRKGASLLAAKLLRKFPVADINIEESPIEDIIREVFTGKDVS